ncbi:hypothetical protein Tco_1548194 [Tanacetum coccineum]
MFVELMDKRKKHFARLRAEEQRRNPPTKAQKINTMSTYLKNMAGYKHNQLKTKIFKDIQMLFDKAMTRVNTFIDIDTELVKGSETRTERSSKRAGEELDSKNLKKLDENVEAKVDDEADMKKHMEIVPDDNVAIDYIPLATKPPIIVDWKIIKEGKMGYFQILRADGSLRRYSSMIKMLQNIDREYSETLWKSVKAKHGLTRPEEAYERVFWGDLKVMFEPDVESEVWRNLQGHKVTVWKLFSSSGVHFVRFQNLHIFMLRSSGNDNRSDLRDRAGRRVDPDRNARNGFKTRKCDVEEATPLLFVFRGCVFISGLPQLLEDSRARGFIHCNGYSKEDKNEAKLDKTEHEIGRA